jgi:hypothetical protein
MRAESGRAPKPASRATFARDFDESCANAGREKPRPNRLIHPGKPFMKRNDPALCATILLCLAQGPAAADGHPALSDADIAYSAERYAEAAALYRRDAELGVVAAQVNLAILYAEGQGVPQDYAQAALWFRRAAEQGNREAQYNLARLYKEGKGLPKDEAEADKWLRKSEGREGSAPR